MTAPALVTSNGGFISFMPKFNVRLCSFRRGTIPVLVKRHDGQILYIYTCSVYVAVLRRPLPLSYGHLPNTQVCMCKCAILVVEV